ncbi:MAG: hypothetical protein GY884_29600, partial [Proteobacteria bacterium]|nr:hypothetical protein [Pseudomonadota bacterium]
MTSGSNDLASLTQNAVDGVPELDLIAQSQQIVDEFEEQWRTSAELADGFSPEDWESATALPGWSVKDNYSHMVGTEAMLRGEPTPDVSLEGLDHLTAPSSPFTEPAVAA